MRIYARPRVAPYVAVAVYRATVTDIGLDATLTAASRTRIVDR